MGRSSLVEFEYSICKNCNAKRPFEHIYCYVCGEELILPTPREEDKHIRFGICPSCGKEFKPRSFVQKYCGNKLCQKIRRRITNNNRYRKEHTIHPMVSPRIRLCSICGKVIPSERATNYKVITCSWYCDRIKVKNYNSEYYRRNKAKAKVKVSSNGKDSAS